MTKGSLLRSSAKKLQFALITMDSQIRKSQHKIRISGYFLNVKYT